MRGGADKREAIALPIEKVASDRSGNVEYGDDPRSPLMRLEGRRRPARFMAGPFSVEGFDLASFAAARYGAEN